MMLVGAVRGVEGEGVVSSGHVESPVSILRGQRYHTSRLVISIHTSNCLAGVKRCRPIVDGVAPTSEVGHYS